MGYFRNQRDPIVSGSTVFCWAATGHSQTPFSLKSSWKEAEAGRLRSRAKDKIGGTPVVKVDERRSEQTTGKH